MNFIPEQPKAVVKVPYFDDVTEKDGWQGMATGKSIERLQDEIKSVIARLGGLVVSFQRGTFVTETQKREGYQLHYMLEGQDERMYPGRIDIAALPVKENYSLQRSLSIRREKSLKMALYMLRNALEGTWFLQQLSPGYAPLMPWMLADKTSTITELWARSAVMSNLLPAGEEFVEGTYSER